MQKEIKHFFFLLYQSLDLQALVTSIVTSFVRSTGKINSISASSMNNSSQEIILLRKWAWHLKTSYMHSTIVGRLTVSAIQFLQTLLSSYSL